MPGQVVLFLTHRWGRPEASAFADLSVPGVEPVVLYDRSTTAPPSDAGVPIFVFDLDAVRGAGYRPVAQSLVPGSNHFPLFLYARQFPGFDDYWLVEHDVRFTGSWAEFFEAQATASDFLTSQVFTREDHPSWHWWDSLCHPDHPAPEAMLKSFNPIYRISRAAVEAMERCFAGGWVGHHEVALPTLIHHAGLKVEDFGGHGPFVAEGNVDRFYTRCDLSEGGSGSMRYRPVWETSGPEPGKLYHPVKS